MKFWIIIMVILISDTTNAQVPLAEIEGRLSIYLPGDTTSIHIGKSAGVSQDVSSSGFNTFIGNGAGNKTTSGQFNSFFGHGAGSTNSIQIENSYFGYGAGENSTGIINSFFGSNAGRFNTTGSGNSFFGVNSGIDISTGQFNLIVGANSGNKINGSGNVLIGFAAGPNSQSAQTITSLNNRLYINNEAGSDPLIYGEFDNDLVRINGDVYSTGQIRLNNANDIEFLLNDSMTYKPVLTLHENNDTFLDGYDDLRFRTGVFTIDRMIIDQDGNIGVGTTAPTAPFHVNHFMKLEPTSSEPDCSDSNDEGRIYYEASPVHKLRVCTTTNGTTFFWADLH